MSEKVIAYLNVFYGDERFGLFAVGSLVLTVALVVLMRNTEFVTKLLLASAALLLVFAFVVLAPLSSLSLVAPMADIHPVILNFNFGFLALGCGLALKFLRTNSPSK